MRRCTVWYSRVDLTCLTRIEKVTRYFNLVSKMLVCSKRTAERRQKLHERPIQYMFEKYISEILQLSEASAVRIRAKSWCCSDVYSTKWYGRPWKQWKTIEVAWYAIQLSRDKQYRRSIHSCISWAYFIIHWQVWEKMVCHDLESWLYFQGQCHNSNIAKSMSGSYKARFVQLLSMSQERAMTLTRGIILPITR